jgi:hypothetical protein
MSDLKTGSKQSSQDDERKITGAGFYNLEKYEQD